MRAILLMSVVPLSLLSLGHFPRPAMSVSAEVAVAPFTVESDSSGVLRAVADTCLQRLVRTLTELHVSVAQLPELSEKTLTRARPASLALLGHVERKDGLIQA
jgi:hypothetical protein